jgi:hypothetical protein
MLVLNSKPLLATVELELEDRDFLIAKIREKASKEQSKTSIRLNTAYCKIYQPYKFNENTFENCRNVFSQKVSEMMKGRYKVNSDIWGLDYENGEGTAMHHHEGPHQRLSAIYYLVADEGCGSLVFQNPDIEIEPKPNMFVLFDSSLVHGVLPAINEEAKRTCIAMNLRYLHEPIRLSE